MKISIITPCFNEAENIEICYQQLKAIFEHELIEYDYEHIFADNASTDGTMDVLRELCKKDKRLKVIKNSRNVGPFNNMWNALKYASGDAIIPMLPADLQDPPHVIPELLEKFNKGNLVVYGVRSIREENYLMRSLRGTYYRLIQKFASANIPLNAGEFLIADRRIIRSILETGDNYPYIRGLIAQTGVKSEYVEYIWKKRVRGKSKNNWFDLIDQAINGFISTSRVPARISLILGFILSFLGIFYAIANILIVVFSDLNYPMGIPTIIVGMFVFGGIQLFFMGILGEYILSIHGQVRPHPKSFTLEEINFNNN